MRTRLRGAGAPALPAHRPLTLFNTLITVLKEFEGMFRFLRVLALDLTSFLMAIMLSKQRADG